MPPTTMITVAPSGGSVTELVRTARACAEIGAGVVRVPTLEPGRLVETVAALREQTGAVLRVDSDPDVHPDLAACPPDAVELHAALRDRKIVAFYEITDHGRLTVLQRLLDQHGPPYGETVHCELVLRTPDVVPALAAALPALPAGATFTVLGSAALPAMLAALAAGGHLRVGLADTTEYAPGEPARDNAQLVARAAGLARIAQRPPARAAEVRSLLGVRT